MKAVAAAAAMGLAVAVFSGAAWLWWNSSSSAPWPERVEACRPVGGQDAAAIENKRSYECIQNVTRDAVARNDVAAAARAVTGAAARDNRFYALCHEAMHTLGPELLETYGSAEEAIKNVNTIDCGNGLAHGVLDAWAALEGISERDFATVVQACEEVSQTSPGGCGEGIGHAAYQHQKPGTTRQQNAFKLCELFNTSDLAFACAYGAIMQPYFKQNPKVISEAELPFPPGSGLVDLCQETTLAQPVLAGCFAGAGWMMALEYAETPEKFPAANDPDFITDMLERVSYCENAGTSKENRNLCQDYFFARLPLEWYRDVDEFMQRCATVGDKAGKELRQRCIAGAYEFTPPDQMLKLLRSNEGVVELVRPRWERERGPLEL